MLLSFRFRKVERTISQEEVTTTATTSLTLNFHRNNHNTKIKAHVIIVEMPTRAFGSIVIVGVQAENMSLDFEK